MDNRRYQIFVSSTYTDLQEERTQLLFAILKLNYIPAGMEFFSAVDEEQMEFIKRVIDESDYYVLLLGARYGSLDSEGVSYTEREYDYAVSKGKKVIALIHKNPDSIERGKTDRNEELFQKFMAFRQKVINAKRLVAFWDNTAELILNFQSSLIQTIQRFPAIGWMRGDSLANAETLQKLAASELENLRLKEHIKNIGSTPIVTDLKMEARSITNPTVFSETEIECVSLVVKVKPGTISDIDLFTRIRTANTENDLIRYYTESAIPWFIKIAKTCRIDLRITNPNSYIVKNMRGENYFVDSFGKETPVNWEEDFIENSPCNPQLGFCPMTMQINPECYLNPMQSTIYTHFRYFIPEKDCEMTYKRIIFGENIPEPITKEVKVHFRLKEIEIETNELVHLIQDLERKQKFNDAGVFKYVASVLAKENKESIECNMK